jgi:hypothetical protein
MKAYREAYIKNKTGMTSAELSVTLKSKSSCLFEMIPYVFAKGIPLSERKFLVSSLLLARRIAFLSLNFLI